MPCLPKSPSTGHAGRSLRSCGTHVPLGTGDVRIEGHHVSLDMTMVKGELISSTPLFFGADPREVRQVPQRGLRVLAGEEDKARALVNSLDARHAALPSSIPTRRESC